MFLRRSFRRLFRVPAALQDTLHPGPKRPDPPRHRLLLEQLEDRVVPSLLGLAQQTVAPDITSGVLTHLSYTQVGNNANLFHYDAVALALTLGDGSRANITKPTTGNAAVTLNMSLDNSGVFSSGVPTGTLTVTGKVTANAQTFNGTLVTAQVRGFGFSNPTKADTEFEVRLVVTGGLLAQQPTGLLQVGGEMGLLIHQPGLTITTFPQSFSSTSTTGASDLKKTRTAFTNGQIQQPPVVPGQGGINTINPSCGCGLPDVEGNPTDSNQDVDMYSGESDQEMTFLDIPSTGFDYQFSMAYRSGWLASGPLGHNWDFSYDRRLVVVTAQDLTEIRGSYPTANVGDVLRLDGLDRGDLYVHNPDGSYTDPAGFFTQLVHNGDGTYRERDSAGNIVTYAAPAGDGISQMTSLADRDGNTMTFQYNSLGQLTTVNDTLGRPITYTYNSQGELSQVQDFSGRSLTFQYDNQGNPISVTTPPVTGTPNANDFPQGKTTRYTYSSGYSDERLNRELLTVTQPNEVAGGGPPQVQYTYGTNPSLPSYSRVVSQQVGGTNQNNVPAGGTITYQYQSLGTAGSGDYTTPVFQTTATDRNGNQTQYQFNQLGNIVRERVYDNRGIQPGDPAFFQTTYTYNGDYLMLSQTMPQGNSITYTYDTTNPDRYEQGNLLTRTETPDAARGGDQTAITTTYTYEPIYNQVHTMTEPRGNDPSYVPQNGGAQSAARYTTTYTYDYQEGTNTAALASIVGVSQTMVQSYLTHDNIPMGLGDVNGDGTTSEIDGELIRTQEPTVNLLAGSNEAVVEGSTLQPIVTLYTYNSFGQMTGMVDPEGNVTQYDYYGRITPDSGPIVPTGGGYLAQTTEDTTSSANRDSGTNPAPVSIRHQYFYDAAGNMTREVDGRGIATDYVYNQLKQVVQTTEASATGVYTPSVSEPLPLTSFRYLTRYFYDYNDNVVLTQVEDRGNTSNVAGPLPGGDAPNVPGNFNPAGTAFESTITKYDILNEPIETVEEVQNGASPEWHCPTTLPNLTTYPISS
jgi:YD repeat-containing protein